MLDKKFFWILFVRRPSPDVDVLAVLVLGRPGNFRKLTSSDVLVPVVVFILAVLAQKFSKIEVLRRPRPRPGRPRPPASYEN